MSPDGRIQVYDDVLLTKIKISKTAFATTTIWDLLTLTDQHRLQHIFETGLSNQHEQLRLNFIDSSQNPHTFD